MDDSLPIVKTALGKIQGKVISTNEPAKPVYLFSGIPFAKPPLKEFRFQPPQKLEPQVEVLKCTTSPPSPMQISSHLEIVAKYSPFWHLKRTKLTDVSEDCLYLNVYTPTLNCNADLPVLFCIHGGAFKMGGCVSYTGDVFCSRHNLLLVVANYRTNVFGFFETGKDTVCSGNMGLKDQVAALEWTRDNIRAFGGDPSNVTIYGESAGASSVCLHLLSPMSRGLFHRAIVQSGTAELPGTFDGDKSLKRKELLEKLNIRDKNPELIIKKMREFSAEELLKAQHEVMPDSLWLTIDGEFLPAHPRKLLMTHGFAPVPLMLGFNNTEGHGVLALSYPPPFADGLDDQSGSMMLKSLLEASIPANKVDDVIHLVTSEYLELYPPEDKYRWSKLIGSLLDGFIGAPMVGYALAHSGTGHPTYLSYMTHQLLCNHNEKYVGKMKTKPVFCEADHGDDLAFTFGVPFASEASSDDFRFSDEERELSRKWMTFIARFAATGNPNSKDVGVEWPGFDPENRQFLEMRTPVRPGTDIFFKHFKMWLEKLPALMV